MEYDEIIKISDLEKRNDMFIEFYKELGVEDWLSCGESQKIEFVDRTEYKKHNKYHRLDGPAIDNKHKDGLFYIDGVMMEENEWKEKSKMLLRKIKMKNIME